MNCTAWHMSTIHDLAGTHSIHDLCITVWTVRMSENAIGRHRPMCFSVRPPCNPTLVIKGMCGLVSNESARTTDGEQRRHSSRSGRRRMNNLSEHGFTSHSLPPSNILHRASDPLARFILRGGHPVQLLSSRSLHSPLVLSTHSDLSASNSHSFLT